ncbi:uncharacterized protein ACR2FA_005244 [Aphomia sociella]
MVVFTCGHCGESVQKPKVEKHYLTKCRNRSPNLSCMDCFKDFYGNDYESHIKCITEEERYSGKGFVAKEKKGEKMQNAWVEILQSVLNEQQNVSGNVRRIIDTVSKHTNTPRKKPKFINFVKNVCGHKTNPKDIEQAWDLISVKLTELSNARNNQNKKNNETDTDIKKEEQNGSTADNDSTEENNLEATTKSEEDTELSNGNTQNEDDKKLTKKQRKEEKKRKKYEAELQSAVAPPVEEEEGDTQTKKGKKKKNRTESVNGESEENAQVDGKKQKKRKRQDTVNGVQESSENANGENIENEPLNKEKTQKKKLKVLETDLDVESICLHDQNVATTEDTEIAVKNGTFDWHAVIISVLEKKGNEVPFKRLQKKVLAEFFEMTGQDIDDRIADKFIKKLKSAPNVRVDKNRVLLLQ